MTKWFISMGKLALHADVHRFDSHWFQLPPTFKSDALLFSVSHKINPQIELKANTWIPWICWWCSQKPHWRRRPPPPPQPRLRTVLPRRNFPGQWNVPPVQCTRSCPMINMLASVSTLFCVGRESARARERGRERERERERERVWLGWGWGGGKREKKRGRSWNIALCYVVSFQQPGTSKND